MRNIEIDGDVWSVVGIDEHYELPTFKNEEGVELSPTFDEYEDVTYWAILIETECEEWMDTYEELCNKAKTDRRLKARADEWYRALETVNYEEAKEGEELPIEYFDEFQREYMIDHKEEVKERLERFFDYEVVDWWFNDEPIDTLFGEGDYYYDVWDIEVKFGKKLEK